MASESTRTRPGWLFPLLAFVVGLLVGWLIIGWGVWPVTYTNSLPQDLRAAERDQYLSMVAESYARTGDLELAQERLRNWPDEELAPALGDLQARLLATDPQRASELQLLAGSRGAAVVEGEVPQPQPDVNAAPGPVAPVSEATDTSRMRSLCSAGLWVLLALAGITLFVWLFNRLRRSRSEAEMEPIGETVGPPSSGKTTEQIAAEAKALWVTSDDELAKQGQLWQEADDDDYDVPPAAAATSRSTATRTPVAGQSSPPPKKSSAGGAKLAESLALYQMGEPDYDEAFDIHEAGGAYLGQCGLQLNDPVGKNRDQAVALQVWLWDSGDPDTRTKVLMSEGAYRDTAMRAQQASNHEAIVVKPGTEFELESHNLILRGAVEKVEYADQEPHRTVFSELQVRLSVYRKA